MAMEAETGNFMAIGTAEVFEEGRYCDVKISHGFFLCSCY
jgi:hypothetical protein